MTDFELIYAKFEAGCHQTGGARGWVNEDIV